MHPLDAATVLTRLEDGRLRGETSPAYANFTGPYGGVTAATLLRAVMDSEAVSGDPVALTVNFCTAIADGTFEIAAKVQRTGKYTQHWSLELLQDGTTCATATVVCGVRSPTFSHQARQMPSVPDPATIPPRPMTGMMEWLNRYEYRYVEGTPSPAGKPREEPADPLSLVWISDVPERRLDHLSLAAMSDSFLLRVFHVRGGFTPMGTVSLTTYFHASADELAAQGTGPLLGSVDAKQFHDNFHDQHMEIWGADGRLLATGVQVAWYKE